MDTNGAETRSFHLVCQAGSIRVPSCPFVVPSKLSHCPHAAMGTGRKIPGHFRLGLRCFGLHRRPMPLPNCGRTQTKKQERERAHAQGQRDREFRFVQISSAFKVSHGTAGAGDVLHTFRTHALLLPKAFIIFASIRLTNVCQVSLSACPSSLKSHTPEPLQHSSHRLRQVAPPAGFCRGLFARHIPFLSRRCTARFFP